LLRHGAAVTALFATGTRRNACGVLGYNTRPRRVSDPVAGGNVTCHRHEQLPARVHPAQERSVHHGARARATRAAARSQVLRSPARLAAGAPFHQAAETRARRGLPAVHSPWVVRTEETRLQSTARRLASR